MNWPSRNLRTATERIPPRTLWRSGLTPRASLAVQSPRRSRRVRGRGPHRAQVAAAPAAPRSLRGWAARRRAGAAVARETERGQWAARSPAEPGCCGSSWARVGGSGSPGGAGGRRVLGQREVAVAPRGEAGERGTPLVAAHPPRSGAARELHLPSPRARRSPPRGAV